MVSDGIPDDIRLFIRQYIKSIAMLEALLLFKKHPDQGWNLETLAKRLYIDVKMVQALVTALQNWGFIGLYDSLESHYQYNPRSIDLDKMVERLAETYAKCLIPVTHLIHTAPTTSLQQFADAFKFIKDKKKDS